MVEFEEGYRLVLRPSFLVNLAQAYRQLGRLDQARAMYEKFLAAAPMDDPMREDVGQILSTLPRVAPAPVPPPTPAPAPAVDAKRDRGSAIPRAACSSPAAWRRLSPAR